MREEREREKRSWDSGETERAFFLTTRARCLLWPSRWTRKSLAQPGPPGRAGIRIRRRQGKIVHQARPGGRAGRQAGWAGGGGGACLFRGQGSSIFGPVVWVWIGVRWLGWCGGWAPPWAGGGRDRVLRVGVSRGHDAAPMPPAGRPVPVSSQAGGRGHGHCFWGIVFGETRTNKSMSDEAGRQAERRLDVSVARARRCLQTARQRRKVLVDVQAPVRVRTGQDAASSKC